MEKINLYNSSDRNRLLCRSEQQMRHQLKLMRRHFRMHVFELSQTSRTQIAMENFLMLKLKQ